VNQRLALVIAAAVVAVAVVGACGRSAEPAIACPAPAADCDDLLAQQQAIESAHAAAAVEGGDAAVRVAAGECAVQLSRAALDGGCVEACVELCRLHPCPVLDESGAVDADGDCAARCGVVIGENAGIDLDRALARAAEDPGLCSCRGCGAPDDALCTALFDCATD
jgi:hypothetical protein